MFRRRSLTEPIDYLSRRQDRRKLTNYLRTGGFKHVSGSRQVGEDAFLKRIALFIIASALLITGFAHALF